MTWFTAYMTREGKGVPKDAPVRAGLPLLADVIRREWWMLLQLNLLYILFALPLVTLPAAQVATSRITVLMLEDRPVYLLRDFWEAFRDRFWRATLLGVAVALIVAMAGYATVAFFRAATDNVGFVLPMVVVASTGLFVILAAMHALTLLAMADRPLSEVVRLALLGALIRPLPALGALGIVALLWLLHIVFYPASIFMPALVNFAFGTLAVSFGVHRAAARLLALDTGAAQAGTRAGGGAQLRVQ